MLSNGQLETEEGIQQVSLIVLLKRKRKRKGIEEIVEEKSLISSLLWVEFEVARSPRKIFSWPQRVKGEWN